ncbi:sigma 54-interacting transcriptional regulator [Clostridium grantii]|uniref:Transcriptional regulator containing PAS, AAA-type ATPase, and DNA-binding Fis domains n=1 Tax=Clostridium grantii DSM 8605 TaxID=1121316 RepID=A0A1M5VTK4_9CLOT|nr:sigma 54-interacting transcriptional regulator [Clostridium grantii]SHH78263.1 Transcriptional regulator containing PAS, AAA-type ATPase, and DNA-binding Fis domains [Clostridium grantii DSM 8605]
MKEESLYKNIIERSHKRSEEYGVEKDRIISKKIIKGIEIQENIEKNKLLINAAIEDMNTLYSFLKDTGFVIILTDKDGCILSVIGDKDILNEGQNMDMIVGAYMNEESIGSNAMGTAIKENIPVQITAKEHFITAYHKWTCSAAPIHNEKGKIIGTLNLTGESKNVHPHSLGLVVAAVKSIENKLRINSTEIKMIEAYEYINAVIDSVKDGIYVVGRDGRVKTINKAALALFGVREDFILNKRVDDILPNWEVIMKTLEKGNVYEDEEANLKGNIKGTFHLSVTPIFDGKVMIGIVVTFKELENILTLVKHYSGYSARYTFDDIVGESKAIKEVIEFSKAISKSPSTVLINGESGTGKELMAQSIHNESDRAHNSFIAVNCGAIPNNLIESELFGYAEGAFTGAKKSGCPGKFELANKGTLFLDEIGEMPLHMQVKLLRVLQENVVTRVGASEAIDIDVRIIAATNKNLKEEVKKGSFREDLFYRLNVIPIIVPSLRERKEDIPILLRYYLRNKAIKLNKHIPKVSESLKKSMIDYDWPGNIRELENFIENVVNFQGKTSYKLDKENRNENEEIVDSHIVCEKNNNKSLDFVSLEVLETEYIKKCLIEYKGNISKVSKKLEISRNTLYTKIKKYNIDI